MDQATNISIAPPVLKSQDFSFLREEGMNLLRMIAADTWTDHNFHDPGITMLEAMCYAITEMGLRTGMDIHDLVASDTSGFKQQFFTAAEIFPVAPLTLKDLRKILIDHPLVRNAWLFTLAPDPGGKFSVLLEFADDTLNSNTFNISVGALPLTHPYQVDLAFPYWDETDALPFREEVTLLSALFDGPPGSEWNPISGSNSYFARVTVSYQPISGPALTTKIWIVAQVNTPLDNPMVELPLILPQLTTLITTLGDNSQADHTLIKQYSRRVQAASNAIASVHRYLKDYRNLCEDFAEYKAVRLQEIAVGAIIDVNPGVVLENLLADIFFSIDQFISPENIFHTLSELQGNLTSDQVFEGPLLESGFLPDTSLSDTTLPEVFYVSDILRLILQLRNQSGTDIVQREDPALRNIVAVRSLNLANYLDNHPITSNARDCLRLVESQRHIPRLSLQKSRIVFYRNDIEVTYDLDRVIQIFNEKKANAAMSGLASSSDILLPDGETYPVGAYYPIQNDLPQIYGVGEAGLPLTAGTERQALALQLKGYLFFYEQLTSGIASQLAHFNAFFSADPAISQTAFPLPLFDVPQVDQLLKSFDPLNISWTDFINDPENGYVMALKTFTESKDQFLARRNQVLDHVMSVFGEDMVDRAALEFREASFVTGASAMTLTDVLQIQTDQKNQALENLINGKSAFVYDLPALDRDRAQSFGNPAWRTDKLLQVQETGAGVNWSLRDDTSTVLFINSAPASTAVEGRRQAAEAFSLATSQKNYFVVTDSGGIRKLALKSEAALLPTAESMATYATDALALAVIPDIVASMQRLWINYALTPLEGRLYHMLGMRIKERRQLIDSLLDYFEIFDEPAPHVGFEKRFRLWTLPGFTGDQLLVNEVDYTGAADADAVNNATAAVRTVVSRGIFQENFRVENPAPGNFQVVLMLDDTSILARSPVLFATAELAKAELQRISGFIYRIYSIEGFYLIEHMRFYKQKDTDVLLNVEASKDPYSFQISFIFPSGFARDFSVTGSIPQPAQPDKYRDLEFRKYTEIQIRKSCPAHILPRILWIDTVLEGTPVSPSDASFNNFEQAYRAWLQAWLTDGVQETVIAPLRNNLAGILNAIYQEISS